MIRKGFIGKKCLAMLLGITMGAMGVSVVYRIGFKDGNRACRHVCGPIAKEMAKPPNGEVQP